MRYSLAVVGVLFPAILLASCTFGKPKELPPEEVLRRAIIQTMLQRSIDIDATVTLDSPDAADALHATLVLTGALFPLRSSWTISLGGTVKTGDTLLDGKFSLLSSPSAGMFLRVRELHQEKKRASFVDHWLKIATGSNLLHDTDIIPDPKAIEAFASAIAIDSSLLQKESDGAYAYRLAVHVKDESMQITGTLLIDASVFRLRSATWRLRGLETPMGLLDIDTDIHFHPGDTMIFSAPLHSGSIVPLHSIFDMIRPK